MRGKATSSVGDVQSPSKRQPGPPDIVPHLDIAPEKQLLGRKKRLRSMIVHNPLAIAIWKNDLGLPSAWPST